MTANLTSAIGAYTNAARGGAGIEPRAQEAGQSFSELVQSAAESALQSGLRAEEVTLEAIDGSAEVSEVVTAIADAEIALQTVVAMRDQVVAAYQEILRMPI